LHLIQKPSPNVVIILMGCVSHQIATTAARKPTKLQQERRMKHTMKNSINEDG
jgi:hypothetical protein